MRSGDRPTVFIGSSTEGSDVAKAIQRNFERERSCESVLWSQGLLQPGEATLEGLEDSLEGFDFAVLVATADDLVESRELSAPAPRDNVLLELGMCIGQLGRRRAFLVCDGRDLKLPSDLAGITRLEFERPQERSLEAALGACCSEIEERMNVLGRRAARDATSARQRMDYYVGIHDPQMLASLGVVAPRVRPKGDDDCVIDQANYYAVDGSLAYERVPGARDGEFAVAVATQAYRRSKWLWDDAVIYRELIALHPGDDGWWTLFLKDLARPPESAAPGPVLERQLAISREVARFQVEIDGEEVQPCALEVVLGAGFLLRYEWPELDPNAPVRFKFSFAGLQAKAQEWFPLYVAEPTESLDITFDYSLAESIEGVRYFEAFDCDGEPSIEFTGRKLVISYAQPGWIRYGFTLVEWNPPHGS